ncbi:MAG: hypothetical protein BWZ10_03324 [candidate division BRC1 bacterium ADurb.BinA364]|nr:MAG: hypothetical protein BWZ10_03324 [candidate division BRC1 bacterium ADurb.BinA364]
MLPGAAGDINHRARAATFMPPGGPRKAEQIGRAIAGAAIYAVERSNPLAGSEVDGLLERIPVPYYTRSAALRAKVEAMRGREDLHEMDRYLIAKFDDWPHDGESRPIPVQVLRVGEAAFAAFPAEMFVELGLAVKRFSPAGATFVVELANARASTYIPTLDKAERGAYGTIPLLSRLLDSSAGPRLTDAAIAMIDRLWAG